MRMCKQQLTRCLPPASQALLLQSECQALHVEVQTGRQQLEEEKDRGRQLEEHCQQLKEQTGQECQWVQNQPAVAVLQPSLNAAGGLLKKKKSTNQNMFD